MNPLEKLNNDLESILSLVKYVAFLIILILIISAVFYNNIRDYLRDKFDI